MPDGVHGGVEGSLTVIGVVVSGESGPGYLMVFMVGWRDP